MAHFARIDENNTVVAVSVIADADCLDEDGVESEVVGSLFCTRLFGGKWIQTSYNGRIRGMLASVGGVYLPLIDEFRPPVDAHFFWDEMGIMQVNENINPRTGLEFTEGEIEARRLKEQLGKADWISTVGQIAHRMVEAW